MKIPAMVVSGNGRAVNFRREPKKLGTPYMQLPVGTQVTLLGPLDETWCQISYQGLTGWMMSRFLQPLDDAGNVQDDDLLCDVLERLTALEQRVDALTAEWEPDTD